MAAPAGTINVGQKELGPYFGSPKLSGNPQIFLNNAMPITETLAMYGFDSNKAVPMLAESWNISADGKVWTYHIRKGAASGISPRHGPMGRLRSRPWWRGCLSMKGEPP